MTEIWFGIAMLVLGAPLVWIALRRRRIARYRQRLVESREPWLHAGTPEYERRLLSPQPEEVERESGRSVPRSVSKLYQDADLVTRERIHVVRPGGGVWGINHFVPLDAMGFGHHRYGLGPTDLPIARGLSGEVYFVPLDEATGEDGPLDRMDETGDASERITDSFAAFLLWPRVTEPNPPTPPAPPPSAAQR